MYLDIKKISCLPQLLNFKRYKYSEQNSLYSKVSIFTCCVKSVRIHNYSGPYSVQMLENKDQNKSEYDFCAVDFSSFFNLNSRGLFLKPGTYCMHFIVISVVIFSSFSVFVTKVSLEELGLLEKKFSAKQDHNKFSLKHYNMQRKFKGQLF